jgi:hypothetical protein
VTDEEGSNMSTVGHLTQRVGRSFSYANVASTVALVLTLGGGVAYASHLQVFSNDIVDREVKTADLGASAVTTQKIRNGHVRGADLAADAVGSGHVADGSLTSADVADGGLTGADVLTGSLTGSDVADSSLGGVDVTSNSLFGSDVADGTLTGSDIASGSITGTDILESTLSDVPAANTARNVNGEVVQRIEFLAGPGTPLQTVLAAPVGFRLRASCSTDGDIEVYATTDRNARLLTWSVDAGADEVDNALAIESFTSNITIDIVNSDDGDQVGQTAYMTSGGNVTMVDWAVDNNTSGAFGTQCALVGTASSH